MAACANHSTAAAVAFCRTCGKPLCEQCKRDVRGVVYCEDCLVAHLQNVMPPAPAPGIPTIDPATGYVRPPGTPNPTLAAILGVIPGVGAFYNGQYQKGVVHVLMFPALIMLTDRVDYFGVLFPFYFFYMIWDAYKTAKSRITGEEVPDPLGINNLFGMETPVGTVPVAAGGSDSVAATPPANKLSGMPMGAIVLIGLGIMFLLGDISREFVRSFWPVVLIVIGLWKGYTVIERSSN
jgi:hypothetical protein